MVCGEQPFIGTHDCEPGIGGSCAGGLQERFGTSTERGHQCGIEQHVQRHPDGGTGSLRGLTGGNEVGVRTLPRLNRQINVPGGVRDVGQQGQVGPPHLICLVRFTEQVECRLPRALPGSLARPLQGARGVPLIHTHPPSAVGYHRNQQSYAYGLDADSAVEETLQEDVSSQRG